MNSFTQQTATVACALSLLATNLAYPADPSSSQPESRVKVAAVQVSGYDKCDLPRQGHDVCATLLPFIDRAGQDGAQLVVFPEYVLGRIHVPGPETERISAAAVANRIYVIVGCWEVYDDGAYANTALIFDRHGQIAGKYHKTHAAVDHFQGEPAWSRPPADKDQDWFLRNDPEWTMRRGDDLPVFDLDFGKVGVLTCYDGWFPESSRTLSLKGAELIVWINGRRGSVEDYIVKSVMFQSHVAMVTTNQAYGGGTMIGDVPARILARCPDGKVSYVTADVDLSKVRHARRFSRNFQQRRPELYSQLTKTQPPDDATATQMRTQDAHPQTQPEDKPLVATCPFPVSSDIAANGEWIRDFMQRAADAKARLRRTLKAPKW